MKRALYMIAARSLIIRTGTTELKAEKKNKAENKIFFFKNQDFSFLG